MDRTKHWRIYAVIGSKPLAEGPGTLVSLGHQSFTLRVSRPGRLLVRVHYTPYWQVTSGSASLAEAPGNWTQVTARKAGLLTVRARFSLSGALSLL